ncbi:hypothetical protein PAN31117_00592 [Pandoraea anapnoica]|uniref:Uncharacterized protein n=1 Tax=Pandoraea anapnoica TaxID=2508301 RepID=A0A5E4ZM61_9BURK|nr:hypothetical protein PAN31117_00592 [Pandoraea anapnoica]
MNFRNLLVVVSRLDCIGIPMMRIGVAIVFWWVGALKSIHSHSQSTAPDR